MGDGWCYLVGKGQRQLVPIVNTTFHWACGGRLKTVAAPADANPLLVMRDPATRAITWMYYYSVAPASSCQQSNSADVCLPSDADHLNHNQQQEGIMTTPNVNAVLVWNNGKAYFFDRWNYFRYDITADKVDPGYPKPIAGNWPGLWPDGIDAGVVWNNGKAYFFKGSSYMRYDIAADKVDPGYPKPIAGNWPGLWHDGVDAAVAWSNGKAYFFKGMFYVRCDMATKKVDPGYPKPIVGNWPGLWPMGIDAGVVWNGEKAYFFKGSYYIRYDLAADKADPGYPLPIAGNWPGLTGEIEYFTYEINDVPDIDQRWDALPKNGGMYCVPTATLNWMYYLANHGRPSAIPHRPADPTIASLVLLNLASMAHYMGTDPENGTKASSFFNGLLDWLEDHNVPAYITAQRAPDGADITYSDFKGLAFRSALVIIGQGRYLMEDGEFVRHGGHAMTLVGFKRNGDVMEMIVRDPADDRANLNTQSDPVDRSSSVTEETRNVEGISVNVLRWGASSSPYYLFIDNWMAIQPLFALTNPTAKKLLSYQADILTGAITTREFALPVDGELLDLAIHPAKYQASVIARDTDAIWMLDLAEGIWNKTATVAAPQLLIYGGRDHRLFVAQGAEILSFDDTGKPLDRLDTGTAIDAISYDAKNDRLLVASTAAKRILSVAPALKVLEHIEAPEVAGTGHLKLSVNGRDATIVLTRQDSPDVATLRWHPTGALATSRFRLLAQGPTAAIHINRKGRLFASEAGKIATFDTDGDRVAGSIFDGLSAGPLLKVARSSHNLDEERSRRKEWMN